MAEWSRRIRRQISEITEGSPDNSEAESEDFDPRKSETMRRAARQELAPIPRAKRNAGNTSSTSPQTTHSPSNDSKQSIKLTMKVAPSKLREVMRATELESLQDTLGGGKVIDAPRSSRRAQQAQMSARVGTRPKYTEVHESDLEDEEEEEEAEEDDDENDEEEGEEEVEDTTMNDFDEVGAEAEGDTDDEDVEMDDELPPVKRGPMPPKGPKITLKTPAKKGQAQVVKPKVIVAPANVGSVLSVEDQEMRDEGQDDEDEDEDEEDDVTNMGDETNLNDEDPEGEEEPLGEDVEGVEEIDADEDDDLDSDDDDDDEEPGSGTATPDPSKMTSRQRGRPVEPLMALDMAPQQRKFFTDEEKAMKKDEHARKRKELTKRKTQEEKTAALNRLLKPQVSKTRGAAPKAETLAAQMQAAAEEEEIEHRADPLYTRWVSSKDGIKLGVPDEWLGKQVGRCFGPPLPPNNGALVQELD